MIAPSLRAQIAVDQAHGFPGSDGPGLLFIYDEFQEHLIVLALPPFFRYGSLFKPVSAVKSCIPRLAERPQTAHASE
jgi:hypothetical protein